MEVSQHEPGHYRSQLETIKAIESNLLQLQSRINYLGKEQARTAHRVEKLLQASAPIIKNKMQETHSTHLPTPNRQSFKAEKEKQAKMSRMVREMELENSKAEICKAKTYGSLHVREISKHNQKLIAESKKQWLEEKKKKSQLVKACRLESRRKIEEFYSQKQKWMRRQKLEETAALEKRISQTSLSLANLATTEALYSKKYQKSQQVIQRLQKATNYVKSMKPQQFHELFDHLQLGHKAKLTDEVVETILLEATNQTDNGSDAVKGELKQSKRFINRHKSEDFQLKTIYGSACWKKCM